jgi:hypothetical protein
MKCRICNKELCIHNRTGECYYHNENPEYIRDPSRCSCSGGKCGNYARYTQLLEEGRISNYL